jgi:hypothetical protein
MQPSIEKRGHENIRAFFSHKAPIKGYLVDDQLSKVKSNVNFFRKPGNQTASVMCNEEYQQQNQDGRPEIAPFHFSGSLAKTVLNSLSANIAILDEYGVILETNQAWRNYATANEMEGFRRGGIIVMGTDGVWEARNESGQINLISYSVVSPD